jgi:hypothetical protein
MRRVLVVAALVLAGCEDTVPVWQLDNDRIIAVRATPPHIPAGASATLDALVTRMGQGPSVAQPTSAAPARLRPDEPPPPALASLISKVGDQWVVSAPDESTLATVRAMLGLSDVAPIPFLIEVTCEFGSGTLRATKVVMLGQTGDNPVLGEVTVGGAPAADGTVIAKDTDVALHASAGETDEVDWLTSVGELSDEDDPDAMLRYDSTAEPPSSAMGHLAVVMRDDGVGVTWAYWTVRAGP